MPSCLLLASGPPLLEVPVALIGVVIILYMSNFCTLKMPVMSARFSNFHKRMAHSACLLPFLGPPAALATTNPIAVSGFACSGRFLSVGSHTLRPSVSGFFFFSPEHYGFGGYRRVILLWFWRHVAQASFGLEILSCPLSRDHGNVPYPSGSVLRSVCRGAGECQQPSPPSLAA